ncbi:TPA_exp: Uncharacterized protein A8136_2155 [Trichophyton benhamiae CBS 112371]|uniref:Cytochrome c oxidase assembly factor 6 n=1 Tax=Arthroderma benhamiae (strain ATCC MYA-4681 / CBS 112371) TaxID=663331 RepID=D4AYD0_ARTBC|nr:uncharacterized protein ARB_01199 [Trichophyton benhamiae CBS 112371]EFE31946.1 hypothetical protein ARB_01199 [Trichophyton benhamiae CBS 112371]DAA75057.1 TPA_exp: Uncharacterized protein A8136_2155 [Trichophyton benhamiae CBS 112371]
MGWFSSSTEPAPKKAADGGSIAPDRTSRQQCWIGRDKFFACLDANNIIDALKEDSAARSKCSKEIQEFESACSATWAKYFKEKRVMEHRRDQTIQRIKREDVESAAAQKGAK